LELVVPVLLSPILETKVAHLFFLVLHQLVVVLARLMLLPPVLVVLVVVLVLREQLVLELAGKVILVV
jgi:hypothetical protein